MVKTNHLGALVATAGALVAVGLLMLMMLVVEVRPAEATFPGKPKVGGGSGFNITDNTTNDYTPSYSPNGKEIVYRGTGSNGRHNEIYTIKVSGGGGSKLPTIIRTSAIHPTRPAARRYSSQATMDKTGRSIPSTPAGEGGSKLPTTL